MESRYPSGVRIAFGIVFFSVLGCSSTSKESPFRPTHVITCRHWTNQCYHIANQKCRSGYDIVSKAETDRHGPPRDRFREYSLVVKCK